MGGLGLCPVRPAGIPGKPLCSWKAPLPPKQNQTLADERGNLQVVLMGSAKDEWALDGVTSPHPSGRAACSFPNL